MIEPKILFALAVFCAISSITPGPNNLMLMNSGARFGLRRTLPHLIGVTGGFSVMVLLIAAGLGGVFQGSPLLQRILRLVSIAYLLYLAAKIAGAKPFSEGTGGGERPMTFLQAVAFQWVNPKAWSMAVTAAVVYAPTPDPLLAPPLTAGLFGAINLPCVSLWVVLGTQLSRFLTSPLRYRLFNWIAAALLVATLYPILAG
jgi:threonine/homoserine/homoserine lactone efflux protein